MIVSIFNEINNLYNSGISHGLITLNNLIKILEFNNKSDELQIIEDIINNINIDYRSKRYNIKKENKDIYIMCNIETLIRLMYIYEIKEMNSNPNNIILELKDLRVIGF